MILTLIFFIAGRCWLAEVKLIEDPSSRKLFESIPYIQCLIILIKDTLFLLTSVLVYQIIKIKIGPIVDKSSWVRIFIILINI